VFLKRILHVQVPCVYNIENRKERDIKIINKKKKKCPRGKPEKKKKKREREREREKKNFCELNFKLQTAISSPELDSFHAIHTHCPSLSLSLSHTHAHAHRLR
jgi:hypothetical protein